MKVRYLVEGTFKTPAQARAAREKEKGVSNVERLASTSSNVIAKQIETKLNEYLTCFDDSRWYGDNDMEKAGRYIYNHIRVTVGYFLKDFEPSIAKVKIEFRVSPKGEDLVYDIFVSPGSTMHNVFYSSGKSTLRIDIGPMKSFNFSKDHFEKDTNNNLIKAAQYEIEHNSKANNQVAQYILDKINSNNFKLNKIHLFEGSNANYYFILDYNKTLAKEVLPAQSYMWGIQKLKELFSFDNDGKNIIIAIERNKEKEKIIYSLDKLSDLVGNNSIYDVLFAFMNHISDYKNTDNAYSSNPKFREDWYNNEFAPYAKDFQKNAKSNPNYLNHLKFCAVVAPTKYVFDITSELPQQLKSIPHVVNFGFVKTTMEGTFYHDKPYSYGSWNNDAPFTQLVTFTKAHQMNYETQNRTSVFMVAYDLFTLGLYLKTGLTYGSSKLSDEDRDKIKAEWNETNMKGLNTYTTTTLSTNDDIIKKLENIISAIQDKHSVMPKRLAKPLVTQ